MRPIFDAHLDLAWNAISFERDLSLPVDTIRRREAGMTDHPSRARSTVSLPELLRGNVTTCVATLLATLLARRDVLRESQAHGFGLPIAGPRRASCARAAGLLSTT